MQDIARHNQTYTVFGVAKRFDMEEHSLQHLAETNPLYAGVTELEPDDGGDPKGQLVKLLFDLIQQVNDFLMKDENGVASREQQMKQLKNHFVNIYYRLNQLRRKQAIVYLKEKLKHDIARRERIIQALERNVALTKEFLSKAL